MPAYVHPTRLPLGLALALLASSGFAAAGNVHAAEAPARRSVAGAPPVAASDADHEGHDHEHDDDDEAHEDHPDAASEHAEGAGDDDHSGEGHAHEDHDEHQHVEDAHDEHDHGDATDDAHQHAPGTVIELSARGLKNIGYEPLTIKLSDYQRSLTLPAMVVERPGRSQLHITAPLTGTVTNIYSVTGEAVEPGDPLFDLRLTHEELVTAQREFLTTIAKLEVLQRELKRLEGLGEGVVAGKRLLDLQYEQQELGVALSAARQAMLLHGLTDTQVDQIRTSRQLLQSVTVRAPDPDETGGGAHGCHLFVIQQLSVATGAHVQIGDELLVLADHCRLYIEALAFEDDAEEIRCACENERAVTAQPLRSSAAPATGLQVEYVAGQIDPVSRAFKVYVLLPNRVVLDRTSELGKRFVEWAYKPGQRMRLKAPVEVWENQLVLPPTAVVDEGAEAYVYLRHDEHFERTPVHVLYRDQSSVVIANDGAVTPGDVIAGRGAYQMHLALKNQSGGGVDPHAGHNH